ncbi:MAG: hypothetical protein MOGMAGMI_00386 [Candidatus Omnitrophica bacterium]|jgi:hypothetical protein|nr:hypothetical protein [Candidatus Omnitrophota bacterium]
MEWFKDPKTGEGSVTLTFATIAFAIFSILICLEATSIVKSTSAANELFFSCLALYLGRRVSFKTSKVELNNEKEDK